jgi:hypothetical protein
VTPTPGLFAILLGGAIVLLTAVGFDSFAPASCSDANDSVAHGLTVQAEKQYRAVLADEPGSKCAARGIGLVVVSKCHEARERADNGLLAAADKLYQEVLDMRPTSRCGRRGRQLVTERSCAAAHRLRISGAADEATEAYEALLSRPATDADCAAKGLAALEAEASAGAKKQDKARSS